MTSMDDELERARRAMRATAGELELTWGDVLERVDAEPETVPVVPLGGLRRTPHAPPVRRVAIAAALVVVFAAGASGLAAALQPHAVPTPPAALPVAIAPDPQTTRPAANYEAAQVVLDRVHDAFRHIAFCAVALRSDDLVTTLWLDKGLNPALLVDAQGQRGRTEGGSYVAVDDTMRTWMPLASSDDLLTDRPDLQAEVAALRLLVEGGGNWGPADDGSPDAVTAVVDGRVITLTVDPASAVPTRVVEAGSAGDELAMGWLTACTDDTPAPTVTVPSGYAGLPASH